MCLRGHNSLLMHATELQNIYHKLIKSENKLVVSPFHIIAVRLLSQNFIVLMKTFF